MHAAAAEVAGLSAEQIVIFDVSGVLLRRYPPKRPIAALPRNDAMGPGCVGPILLQKYVLQGAFRAEVIFLDSAEAMALRQPHVGAAGDEPQAWRGV